MISDQTGLLSPSQHSHIRIEYCVIGVIGYIWAAGIKQTINEVDNSHFLRYTQKEESHPL